MSILSAASPRKPYHGSSMRLRTAGTRPLATGQMLGSLLRSNSWCSSTTIRVRLKPHHRMACAADRRAVRRVCTALYGCATGRPGILELEHVFFQDMKLTHPHLRGETLRPSGLADWAAMQPQLEPLVKQKIIIGFMLGDGGCAAPAPRSSRWQKLARVLIVITLSCCSRDCVEQYQLGGPERHGYCCQVCAPRGVCVVQRRWRATLGKL